MIFGLENDGRELKKNNIMSEVWYLSYKRNYQGQESAKTKNKQQKYNVPQEKQLGVAFLTG